MNQDQTTAHMIMDRVSSTRRREGWHRTWLAIIELPTMQLPPISSAEHRIKEE